MKPRMAVLVGSSIVLVLSGCGGDPVDGTPSVPSATIPPSTTSVSGMSRSVTSTPESTTAPVFESHDHGDHPTEHFPTPRQANVNAGYFAVPNGPDSSADSYFFTSPTRNISCGIYTTGSLEGAGCQAKDAPAPESGGGHGHGGHGGGCPDWMNKGVITEFGASMHTCFHDGVYVQPGAMVLEYGETIVVGDSSCTSEAEGLTCFNGDSAFFIARERIVLY